MTIWEVGDDEKVIEGLDELGRPDPAYAAALGLVHAPMLRRALAATIDLVVYLVLQLPYWLFALPLLLKLYFGRISLYGLVNHPNFILAVVMASISFVLSLAFSIVQLVLHGRKGVTIGKGIMGIRSVNVKTLERPGFWRMVLRALVLIGSSVLVVGPILFCLSPLFDREKRGRGWHDLVGQNWYVDVRKGLHPYDEKRMRIARKMVTAEPVAGHKPLPSLATPSVQGGDGEYRPGGRVSAGVLGVARPHGAGPRPEVGLSGAEEPTEAPLPAEPTPGRPVFGGYRPATQGEVARAEDDRPGADLSTGSGTPPSSPPKPAYTPPAPAAPQIPAPALRTDGMVTGTPWGAPPPAASTDEGGPEAAARQAVRAAAGAPPESARPAASASPAAAAGSETAGPAVSSPPATGDGPAAAVPDEGAHSADVAAPEVEQTRLSVPGYVLYLDDGAQIPVTEALVLGRDPSSNHASGRPVPVTDQTRSVSKTHLAVAPTDDGIEVTDLGSTNGTAVVHEGAERRLEPGAPLLALPGDTVRFGERTAAVGHS
ncbi:RDD family protein [Ruania albidiflava]|uniref:RDD family protein n=1 Tax=Ruania albidiflava TaxID=366586 RepID=UPI0023F21A2B|nr:RDD family protein [Ruania albidiflava]